MVDWANQARPSAYASFAPLIFDHARRGDPLGIELVTGAAAAITQIARRLMELGAGRLCLFGGMAGALEALALARRARRRRRAGGRPSRGSHRAGAERQASAVKAGRTAGWTGAGSAPVLKPSGRGTSGNGRWRQGRFWWSGSGPWACPMPSPMRGSRVSRSPACASAGSPRWPPVSPVRRFSAFAEALDALAPDVVSINTWSDTHADYAIRAMEAGAHVFVEKPLADNVADAERVVETARRTGRKLVVGYILRHHPPRCASSRSPGPRGAARVPHEPEPAIERPAWEAGASACCNSSRRSSIARALRGRHVPDHLRRSPCGCTPSGRV